MKKDKPANPNKALRKDIELHIISQLKGLALKLGKGTKKLNKEIEKGAKKLAKNVSKEITPLVVEAEAVVAKPAESAPVAKKPAAKVKTAKAVK